MAQKTMGDKTTAPKELRPQGKRKGAGSGCDDAAWLASGRYLHTARAALHQSPAANGPYGSFATDLRWSRSVRFSPESDRIVRRTK